MEISLERDTKRSPMQFKGIRTIANGYSMMCALLKKKLRSTLERVFHREKWIRMRYFELASLINVVLGCNQTADRVQKMGKLNKALEESERKLFLYRMPVYRKVKKLRKHSAGMKNFSDTLTELTLLVKHELESASKKFRRREEIQSHLKAAAHMLLNTKPPFFTK
jgi:hypothetical protein